MHAVQPLPRSVVPHCRLVRLRRHRCVALFSASTRLRAMTGQNRDPCLSDMGSSTTYYKLVWHVQRPVSTWQHSCCSWSLRSVSSLFICERLANIPSNVATAPQDALGAR